MTVDCVLQNSRAIFAGSFQSGIIGRIGRIGLKLCACCAEGRAALFGVALGMTALSPPLGPDRKA
jgi:hypothetical protein